MAGIGDDGMTVIKFHRLAPNIIAAFKEIEQKALVMQEDYKKTQEVLLFYKFSVYVFPSLIYMLI